jgi:hexulose-6-phosphate isomerase
LKKSINTWSFPPSLDLAGRLRLARTAGFAGFEIDLSEDGPVNLRSTADELAAVRAAVEREGLILSGLASNLSWSANAASNEAATRQRAERILFRQIECAAALGIDTILVVPGAVGVDFIAKTEVVPYELAWQRARDFVAAALPLAEKHRVVLAIENVWNKFLLSPLEMRSFIDSFGSASVGAYFDIGNALATGYPEHWISILGPRIRRVHFKDYRRAVGTVAGFVELLSGDVNWPAVTTALRAVGYDGWATAEMIPPEPFYQHHPEVLIYNTSRALDAILAD